MKEGVGRFKFLLLLLTISSSSALLFQQKHRGINGGFSCAICTVFVSFVEQLTSIHNETVVLSMERLCRYLPAEYGKACDLLVNEFGPYVIEMLEKKETPDVICFALNFCFTQPGTKQCHLFHPPEQGINHRVKQHKKLLGDYVLKLEEFFNLCDIPGIRYLCEYVDWVFHQHKPGQDIDHDGFSVIQALRGSSWRGRDCNDLRRDIYPGVRPYRGWDDREDTNCNGIKGTNKDTGVPYEKELCQDTDPRGIAVIGDSVGAHFHAPYQWFTPTLLDEKIFKNLSFVIENEGDWPQLSASTGYKQSTWSIAQGPTDSIYMTLNKRNKCNHRDFQNLAVNGANVFDVQKYQKNLSRNKTTDNPLLIVFELVGNDVCNHYADTIAHMTTVEAMRENIIKSMQYLDSVVPAGSYILFVGVGDGRILYNTLHNRYHPMGQLHRDITYQHVYDWWGCLQVTPCQGWLTSNETLRNFTAKRAQDLSKTIHDTVDEYRFKLKNLEPAYMDCPIEPVLEQWVKDHGPHTAYQLIEPVDGFHPNQIANSLLAKYVVNYIKTNIPHFLGDVNPNNDQIEKLFGDQGGY